MSGRRAKKLRQQVAETLEAPRGGYARTRYSADFGTRRCVGLRAAYKALKKAWKARHMPCITQ